ncbi:MAG: glycogen synthase [Dehalococcoidia bacterium]
MKILYAAAEVDPLAKVGGLADVAASLPQRLQDIGHDVRVVTPCHASAKPAFEAAERKRRIPIETPGGPEEVMVAEVPGAGGVPVLLVQDERFFGREAVYGEPDDLERYQLFCRAVLGLLRHGGWVPDILHLNDWHTAPLAFALRNLAWANPGLRGVASVFTVHNLRYRGPDELNDYLAQAIYYSDMVTTVSPNYAREILTQEYGEGLDDLLNLRRGHLRGIINGLNFETFNPRTDPHLRSPFDLGNLNERAANRTALRAELGLPESSGPLAGMVTRLAEQKGLDLVLQAMPEMLASDAQLVVLGQGESWLRQELLRLQTAHPGAIRVTDRFDEGLARRIYAGSDVFLMPSRYEPCGLGQLIAMRYGSVPIGRRTGGLADTIIDPADQPDAATGFLFDEFSTFAFAGAFERAVIAFRDPAAWAQLQRMGMSRDHSWGASATHYVETYVAALRARGIVPLE